MSFDHHQDDDCRRFHPAQEVTVVGFDNPVHAADLEAGDIFFDSQDGGILLVTEATEPTIFPVVHVRTEYADWGQVVDRIRQLLG